MAKDKFLSKMRERKRDYMRAWRKKNRMRDAYNNLKSNSKRRGKPFNISFEDFKEFAIKTDYVKGKGITREAYTVDRIIPNKGYVKGNLQKLSLKENSYKTIFYRGMNPETQEYEFNTLTTRQAQLEVEDENFWEDLVKQRAENEKQSEQIPEPIKEKTSKPKTDKNFIDEIIPF